MCVNILAAGVLPYPAFSSDFLKTAFFWGEGEHSDVTWSALLNCVIVVF